MAFIGKQFACLFIALLIFDALASQALAAPTRFRHGKGMSLRTGYGGRQPSKHLAIPAKVLASSRGKWNGLAKSGGCDDEDDEESCNGNYKGNDVSESCSSTSFCRTYETIGSCDTTIQVVEETCKSIDSVTTESFSLQTISTHETRINVLTNTSTNQRIKKYIKQCINVLTTVSVIFQTLVPISVTIEETSTTTACVQNLSTKSRIVKTLASVSKCIRIMRSKCVSVNRVTSTQDSICAVKVIHEVIEQSVIRSVKCPRSFSSDGECDDNQSGGSENNCDDECDEGNNESGDNNSGNNSGDNNSGNNSGDNNSGDNNSGN